MGVQASDIITQGSWSCVLWLHPHRCHRSLSSHPARVALESEEEHTHWRLSSLLTPQPRAVIHTEVRMIANGVCLLLGLELVPGPRAGWQAGLLLTLDSLIRGLGSFLVPGLPCLLE